MEVLRIMQGTREDKACGAAVQGNFEAAVTAVQGSRTAELRWSALVGTAQAAQGCKDAVWDASTILHHVRLYRYAQALTRQIYSIQEWRHNTYEGVWDARTQERERIKKAMLDEATEQWRQSVVSGSCN